MSKRFTLCLVAAALLTGCGKSPVGALGAKSVAKPVAKAAAQLQPTVKVIKGEAFAADLNDHKYDAPIATARQAIAAEFTKQGLALPAELATRQLQAASGTSVVSVKVVKGPLGGTLTVGKASTPQGKVGVIAAKGPLGNSVVVAGAKGADGGAAVAVGAKGTNGAAAGVIAGKDAQGNAAIISGAKDAQGNAIAQGLIKGADGGAAAFQAVQGANGGQAGRWVASDGGGGTIVGEAMADAHGNAIATQVNSSKDGKVVAQRWLKGANGDMAHEKTTFDPDTRLLTYELTTVINGQVHTGTCTVLIPA
jgi:hypothetical protein